MSIAAKPLVQMFSILLNVTGNNPAVRKQVYDGIYDGMKERAQKCLADDSEASRDKVLSVIMKEIDLDHGNFRKVCESKLKMTDDDWNVIAERVLDECGCSNPVS